MTTHPRRPPPPPPPPRDLGADKGPAGANAAAAPANVSIRPPIGDTPPVASMKSLSEPSGTAAPGAVPPEIIAPAAELDWIEDILKRMIVGLFRFVFVRVPVEIYRALVHWYPTLVQVVRILFLFASWLVCTFGPAALAWGLRVGWFRDVPWEWLRGLQLPWYGDALIVFYTALAVAGSFWGIQYIKLKRRKRKNA